ncbi:hypothetical protein BKA61DRAFT_679463 [Leptodontidium sp. MPI-SDFR-AT-0119]|nr:hypothetical protein BKA61DRAFT_679463 [Leptodontidium sp. MPI-SDFR-AT-0119]
MILGPGLSAPAFLLALARDSELYAEAKIVYKSINYAVTASTVAPFKKLLGKPLDKIKHLTVAFDNIFIRNAGGNIAVATDLAINLRSTLAQWHRYGDNLEQLGTVESQSRFANLLRVLSHPESFSLDFDLRLKQTATTPVVNMIIGSRELEKDTFPAELRNKIFDLASYNGVFELGPHLPTTPNVLLAFAPFKKLYPEIVGHVQAANFVLDDASAVRFQALRNPERGEIRHLTIELSGSVFTSTGPNTTLNASLSYLNNNLTSITIDLTHELPTRVKAYNMEHSPPTWIYTYPTALQSNTYMLQWLMSASRPGVKKVVVVLGRGFLSLKRAKAVVDWMAMKGPKLPAVKKSGPGQFLILTWEAAAGGKLVLG